MRKTYTAELIESRESYRKNYHGLLSLYFGTVVDTGRKNEALMLYNHYFPDVLVFGSEFLDGMYDDFIVRLKNNDSLPIIVMVMPQDIQKITKQMMDEYIFCIVSNDIEKTLENAVLQAKQKLSYIDSMLSSEQMKKYVDVIQESHLPSFICSGNVDNVVCNDAFLKEFDCTQEEIDKQQLVHDFLDRMELKDTIRNKNLINEQLLHINGKSLKCKIYILKQYEAYLITVNVLSNDNIRINMNLKRELQSILDRIEKNFDDHSDIQYKMVRFSTILREFLQMDIEENEIQTWLDKNRSTLDEIELELDYTILEELKHQPLETLL